MIRLEHSGITGWRCVACWAEIAMMATVTILGSLAVIWLVW